MILSDGKHVQGIFIYNPDIEYELGDFIVEEDCIYICKSGNPIKGKTPSTEPSLFSPYPGSMITSIEEYENYTSSPNGREDKYISSNVLSGILQDMYYGFGDSGVIESYIKLKNGKYNIDTQLLDLIGKGNSKIDKPLDLLMREPSVNNAYVQISRNLLDVKYLIADSGLDNCLLRQYTYRDINTLGTTDPKNGVYTEYRYRVQEMVDLENKISYYRTTRGSKRAGLTEWQYNETISDWSCTTVSKALLDKINKILNYYNNERVIEENSRTGFNFMNLSLHQGTTYKCTLLCNDDPQTAYTEDFPCTTPVSNFEEEPLILTINLKLKMNSSASVYKSYTCTINTQDTAKHSSIDYYYLSETMYLKVEYKYMDSTGRNVVVLEVVDNTRVNTVSDATILSIYYRDNGER